MAGNWLISVYFGEEFVLLARNLYVLVKKSSPDLPRRGKIFTKSSPTKLARKNSSPEEFPATKFLSPTRLSRMLVQF